MFYICTKFRENILNGIRVMEPTQKVNGRTDGRPDRRTDGHNDGGHDIIRPVFDGRIMRQKSKCGYFITTFKGENVTI